MSPMRSVPFDRPVWTRKLRRIGTARIGRISIVCVGSTKRHGPRQWASFRVGTTLRIAGLKQASRQWLPIDAALIGVPTFHDGSNFGNSFTQSIRFVLSHFPVFTVPE